MFCWGGEYVQNPKELANLPLKTRMVGCLQYPARVHSKSTLCGKSRVRGKGLTRLRKQNVPPASEREARMDDPTRRPETAGTGMHPSHLTQSPVASSPRWPVR
jgi:hypothetical protein